MRDNAPVDAITRLNSTPPTRLATTPQPRERRVRAPMPSGRRFSGSDSIKKPTHSWISAKQAFQRVGSGDSGEAAAENNDTRFHFTWWWGWLIFRSPAGEDKIVDPLRDETKAGAVQKPTDQGRKQRTHTLDGPVRRLTPEQGETDDAPHRP